MQGPLLITMAGVAVAVWPAMSVSPAPRERKGKLSQSLPEQGAHARGSASTAAPAGASPGGSRRRAREHDATGRTLKAPRGSAGDDDAVVIVID